MFLFLFFSVSFVRVGDSPDHERSNGPQDESAGFEPEEYASWSSADESTLPSQHSQVIISIQF